MQETAVASPSEDGETGKGLFDYGKGAVNESEQKERGSPPQQPEEEEGG